MEGVDRRAGVRARVLGQWELVVEGVPVRHEAWPRGAAERLVKLLLVSPHHALSREAAAETLWPEAAPDSSRASLRKAIHYARRALPGDVLAADDGLVELAVADVDLDRLLAALDTLDRGSTPAGSADPAGIARARAAVLELGARRLLPDDPYEEWLAPMRDRLDSRWLSTALDAAGDAAAAGEFNEAHALLEQILDRDPTDEAAHRLAIGCFAAEGRHHAVRRQFERCCRALRDGLDVTPSDETIAAYRRAEGTAGAEHERLHLSRIVGREPELAAVDRLVDHVAGGRSGAAVIRGPAGIGKTRLLDELRATARGAGWQEIAWQAIPSGPRLAFAPFVFRLDELVDATRLASWPEPERSAVATLVPGMETAGRLPFEDRSALVAALYLALGRIARDRPLLIAVDDLAWLDDASADVIEAIGAVLPAAPILVAVTSRDDEPGPDRAALLAEHLVHAGALDIRLDPLSATGVEPLVLGHLGGESVAEELRAWLYQQSAGNPLFCLELVRDGTAKGVIALADDCWVAHPARGETPAPASVRQLVGARSRALAQPASELLRVASLLGPVFDYTTLASVLGDADGSLVATLDHAIAAGLLAERGPGYAFAHPLYRAAVEAAAGPAARGETRLRIARALAAAGPFDADGRPDPARHGDPMSVAEHALAAAEAGVVAARPIAVSFGLAAGHRASLLLDRPTASRFLARGLEAWRRMAPDDRRLFDASRALIEFAEVRMVEGEEAAAEASFREALAAARTPDELAVAYERFAWLPYRHGDFAAAVALSREGVARLPTGSVGGRALVESMLGWCLARTHAFDEAVACLRRGVAAMDDLPPSAEQSLVLDRLGMVLSFTGQHEEALGLISRAVAVALAVGEPRAEVVRIHLAAALTRVGRAAEARPHAVRVLELTHQMGDWYLESVAAWTAAEVEDELGDLEAARAMRLREIALLARLGGNRHNEALSHAHLANLARRLGQADEADGEARLARELVARDPDPGYAARIEAALVAQRWSDLRTG